MSGVLVSVLRSEQLVGYWRDRYVNGSATVEEMESGIARALDGSATDEEWVAASQWRRFHQPIAEWAGMMTAVGLFR